MKLRIPYAIGNFEELIEGEYYFVDKTAYLRQLERYKVPVFLRPHRFGKSLWCSLLECYYDVNRREKFEQLFGKLDIGREPTDARNSYLVMRFNFSTIPVTADYPTLKANFDAVCQTYFSDFFTRYQELLQENILPEPTDATLQLIRILSMVKNHHLPPVYLIIDEYDNFANQLITSHQDSLYRELTSGDSFLRTFFKVVKAGVEDRSIGRVFITGVLPITIDDLTSGFNIAEIITLEPNTLNMLGFTQAEVERYVETIFAEYGFDSQLEPQLIAVMREFYNGYAFSTENPERVYNSTIISYFLKSFVLNGGKLPRDFIDENLRTDVNWIKRLTSGEGQALAMLEQLMLHDELPYDEEMLRAKFNMAQFFERDFYSVSLFYLGMLTIKDSYHMKLPNQTMRKIFADYYNQIAHIEVSSGYVPYFEQFLLDLDLEKLFAGYWEVYVGQLPAQLFDKMNENFFRTTFFELCSRYLARNFTFGIEVNHPSGRSDWEMLGKPATPYAECKFLLEFKYAPVKDERNCNWLQMEAPLPGDIEQITCYAQDIQRESPQLHVRKYLLYIVGRKGFAMFQVD